MTTDLTLPSDLAPAPASLFYGYTRAQVDLVKRTLMPRGSTDDELHLFLYTANRMGLDPFAQQIRAIRRKEYNADTQRYEEKISIEPGIDGFRLVAQRTGEVEAKLGPYWCGPDGKWVDVWLPETPPAAAKFGVLRKGFREPVWAVALWREYRQTKRDGGVTRMWTDRPAGQLGKCCEALALRSTFPHELGGVYTSDEMAQAGRPVMQPAEVVEVDGEPFDGGIPKTWAIDNIRDPDDARWLLQQPEVDEDYCEAVKNVVTGLKFNWSEFWRTADTGQWRAVLTKARPLDQTSDPGWGSGGAGSLPGSDPTSEGDAASAQSPHHIRRGQAHAGASRQTGDGTASDLTSEAGDSTPRAEGPASDLNASATGPGDTDASNAGHEPPDAEASTTPPAPSLGERGRPGRGSKARAEGKLHEPEAPAGPQRTSERGNASDATSSVKQAGSVNPTEGNREGADPSLLPELPGWD